MKNQVSLVYFSPGGSTKKVAETFISALDCDVKRIDLLKQELVQDLQFEKDDILVVTMPVFAGRIPAVCIDKIQKLKGRKTPVVLIAVYGNRDFDDALLELSDTLVGNGFAQVGAGAFIARHSIFPDAAKGRPDNKDLKEIENFAHLCLEKIKDNERNKSEYTSINIPGNRPYREASPIPIIPTGKKRSCTGCGVCIQVCPVQAINKDNPIKTDKTKCIRCMACVYHCPTHSRGLHNIMYKVAEKKFYKKFSTRKEPFVII